MPKPGTRPIARLMADPPLQLTEWDGNRAEIADGVWMGALTSTHIPQRGENELPVTGNSFSGAAG